MNNILILALKVSKYLINKLNKKNETKPECERNPDIVSNIIFEHLSNDKPCLIARFGAYELATLVNYLGVKYGKKNYISYILGKELDWWWNKSLINSMHTNAGFFPPDINQIEKFSELLINDIPQIDILGSWLYDEKIFEKDLINTEKVWLDYLNPFLSNNPWSRVLENKKVLVVHPFVNTIKSQYQNREYLFKNKNVLPKFELITLKAVQSISGQKCEFKSWFAALDYMKNEIDNYEYDICLIGAGAYGLPLATHVKRQGKKAVHLGGSLQLLFGIRGKRWEDPNLNKDYCFADYINEYWVRPSEEETPLNAKNVEGACYW